MKFDKALEALKKGRLIARTGWNGKDMWLVMVPGSSVVLKPESPYHKALLSMHGEGIANRPVEILPHIDMWTVNAEGRRAMLPGWLASQSDLLSDDWEIVG